ncbi:hypothetical protein KW791_03290 [Candidatus Parcubacteria bacterium]|nr:hypothetical protein [Candidatus Parcubacteria bacterium]
MTQRVVAIEFEEVQFHASRLWRRLKAKLGLSGSPNEATAQFKAEAENIDLPESVRVSARNVLGEIDVAKRRHELAQANLQGQMGNACRRHGCSSNRGADRKTGSSKKTRRGRAFFCREDRGIRATISKRQYNALGNNSALRVVV